MYRSANNSNELGFFLFTSSCNCSNWGLLPKNKQHQLWLRFLRLSAQSLIFCHFYSTPFLPHLLRHTAKPHANALCQIVALASIARMTSVHLERRGRRLACMVKCSTMVPQVYNSSVALILVLIEGHFVRLLRRVLARKIIKRGVVLRSKNIGGFSDHIKEILPQSPPLSRFG